MSGIFSRIGSLISGIREKIAGSIFGTQVEQEHLIDNVGAIYDSMDNEETKPHYYEIENPSQSPAESSSRQQRRAEARAQKKVENRNPIPEPETDIIFREIDFSEWMKRRRLITLHRGIVPKGYEVEGDELLLLESVREKIKSVLRTEQSKKKRLRFTIFLNATMEKLELKEGEDGITRAEYKPEVKPFKSQMEYILNVDDINDELPIKSYSFK